jgi:hypothetical protein
MSARRFRRQTCNESRPVVGQASDQAIRTSRAGVAAGRRRTHHLPGIRGPPQINGLRSRVTQARCRVQAPDPFDLLAAVEASPRPTRWRFGLFKPSGILAVILINWPLEREAFTAMRRWVSSWPTPLVGKVNAETSRTDQRSAQ